ncbi:MAG: hypothetical protein AAF609_18635 [Cyanobacteria bacterium P01_C01_bin.120]
MALSDSRLQNAVMKLALTFDEIPSNLAPAVVDISIEDQSEADRPAPRLFSTQLQSVIIQPSQSTVLKVDLEPFSERTDQLSIIVRVKSQTSNGSPVEYLNTTTTALPKSIDSPVSVALSRIK